MLNVDERCAVMNVNSYFVAGSRPETLNSDWAVNTSVRSVTWEQRLSFTQPSLCKHCHNNCVNDDLHQCEYRILWEEHKQKFCLRSRFAPYQNVCGGVKQWQKFGGPHLHNLCDFRCTLHSFTAIATKEFKPMLNLTKEFIVIIFDIMFYLYTITKRMLTWI